MSDMKYVFRGTLILIIVSVISFALGYILRIMLSKQLSVPEFGLFYAVFSFVSLFALFRSMGMDTFLIKKISELNALKKQEIIKKYIVNSLILRFLIATIVFGTIIIFSEVLANNYFKSEIATELIILLSAASFISIFIDMICTIFSGLKMINWYSSVDLLRNVALIMITILLFVLGLKIMSPGWGYLISSIVTIIIYFLIFRKQIGNINITLNKVIASDIFKSSLPFFFASVGSTLFLYTDALTITFFKTLSDVAYYSVAYPTANMLIFLSVSLGTVIFPLISELFILNKKQALKDLVKKFYMFFLIFCSPVFIVAIFFRDNILNILYGQEYLIAANIFMILCGGMFFYSLAIVNTTILNGISKIKITFKIIFAIAILNLILNIILVPLYGIYGAAIATSFSYLLFFVTTNYYIKKHIKAKIFDNSNFLKYIGMTLIIITTLILSILFSGYSLVHKAALTFVVGILYYVFAFFTFKEELKEIIKKVFKNDVKKI